MKYCILLLIFVSCHSEKNKIDPPKTDNSTEVQLNADQLKNINIELGSFQRQTVHSSFKVTGEIDVPPQNLISISAPLGGFLVSTDLLPGTRVHMGQVISTLEDSKFIELQQDYLINKADLDLAKKNLIGNKIFIRSRPEVKKYCKKQTMMYGDSKLINRLYVKN